MSSTKALRALARAETTKPISIALKPKGSGSLVARKVSTGVRLYYQYKYDGKLSRVPFGSFDERGDRTGSDESQGYTIDGATKRAQALSALAREHGDLVGYLGQRKAENAAAIARAKSQREFDAMNASKYSLEKLCIAYTDHLKNQGKPSARTVSNSLNRWVIDAHPTLAATKAADVTAANILQILTTIIDAGHETTTNRVRSYLSAAYSFGIGSSTNPLAASRAGGFRLISNPAKATVPVKEYERAGERVLSADELTHLMKTLRASDSLAARCAELAIRLGGQRLTQLLAVAASDIDDDAAIVILRDPKGKRSQPRIHALPIDAVEFELLHALRLTHPRRVGAFQGTSVHSVSKAVSAISKAEAEQGTEPYTWRDVRRTCETMLAGMGISKDTRGQLQSHGLGGVQARHYDKYNYMTEKQAALKAWNLRLDELEAGKTVANNVVTLERVKAL